MLPEHTDDTRVDLRRPIFDTPCTPVPAAVLPDLEPDDEDDAATIQLSRLAWPEPPLKLAERPRFIRTDGGVTKTASPMVLRDAPHPTYWRGLAVAVILAASISVFVPRPRSQSRVAAEATPPARPTATAVAQPAITMPPPLIITVGTPPSASATAAPPVSKSPIAVTKLPVAHAPAAAPRRAPSRPVVRAKPAAPAPVARSTAAPKEPAPSETVVDDGF